MPNTAATFAQNLRDYLDAQIPMLDGKYQWQFDRDILADRLALTVVGDNWCQLNLDLKRKLAGQWVRHPAMRMRIATYYVRDWGGIRANREETLERYVGDISAGALPRPVGVASWSKVAAASAPHEHAILDARVSVSLNALQLLCKHPAGVLFPRLPGRNTTIERIAPMLKANAIARGWHVPPRYNEYITYRGLRQMRQCLRRRRYALTAPYRKYASDAGRAIRERPEVALVRSGNVTTRALRQQVTKERHGQGEKSSSR